MPADETAVTALPTEQHQKAQERANNAVAMRGRSVALPDPTNTGVTASEEVFGLFERYASLAYMLPWQTLEYIELLARYNADYNQAVNNIKTLANSGHTLFVKAPTDLATRKLKERLEEKARTIQERHGGIDGLIGKLLDQGATYGAMCGEWVLNEELDDVVDFADVNPRTIRFFWEDEHWAPYQKVKAKQVDAAKARGQKVRGSCIKLNEATFHYYAFDAAPGSPYGVPPFLGALGPIAMQRDLNENMAQIVKKVGLLGMINVAVKSLPKLHGETEDQYQSRATAYLDAYAKALEDMVKNGGMVHFDDAEINTSNITGNAAGATNIYKQNEEQVFSGLNSMPSVQGRSYSTTETYAGVAYDIIIRNTLKYQKAAKRMIEAGYWLMAAVWGMRADSIRLEFNPNKSLHRLQDAQSRLLEIKIGLMLWAAGILNQEEMAQELGYAQVSTEYDEIPDTPVLGNSSPGGGAGATSTDDQIQEPTSSDSAVNTNHPTIRAILDEMESLQGTVDELIAQAQLAGSPA
jgi:hypothetical protein